MRRFLERIAPTWAASPLRRLVQTACLLTFLWLFFYVCWPYSARPGMQWSGWIPTEVDAVTGQISLAADEPPAEPISHDSVLWIVDPGSGSAESLGEFRIVQGAEKELTLVPNATLRPEQVDRLSTSLGPWLLRTTDPEEWPSYYADDLSTKMALPAWILLALDPLVSLSTAIAERAWIGTLGWAAAVVLVCLAIPRGFCGYVCPLGTLIDLFDWAVSRRIHRFRLSSPPGWGWLKYSLLAAVLAASLCGVVIAGFVSAIPVFTRGMAFILSPLQTGLFEGFGRVPPLHAAHYVSIGLFVVVLALGLLGPRFWCRYVCPTGAVFSLASLLRLHQRHVADSCGACGRCAVHCPFDAVDEDYATRTSQCAFCQTCGGLCPADAISFGFRWSGQRQPESAIPVSGVSRRALLSAGVRLGVGCLAGAGLASWIAPQAKGRSGDDPLLPVRPPGSIPEADFLKTCVRCGQCFQVCPNNALQSLGPEIGLDALWTPYLAADWSGCEQSCNRCGQVCPTGAIRALPIEEKRVVRLGLAIIDKQTCLPHAGQGACQVCVEACRHAGYQAIEFVRVGTEMDGEGNPIADTGHLAPVVLPEKCVGCGQCQARCHSINVGQGARLTRSAVRIEAGEGNEDRLRDGSYLALRNADRKSRAIAQPPAQENEEYLPSFLK